MNSTLLYKRGKIKRDGLPQSKEEGAKFTITPSAAAYESVCKGSRVESNISIYTLQLILVNTIKQFMSQLL